MLYDNDTFEHGGRTFRFKTECDHDHGRPWDEDEGCGVVTNWTTRMRCSGELLLASECRLFRYYDVWAMLKKAEKAEKDGWGGDMTPANIRAAIAMLTELAEFDVELLAKGEIEEADVFTFDPTDVVLLGRAVAVLLNFRYLKSWCDDEWQYVGVIVTLVSIDEDGDEFDDDANERSLWGIRSDDHDYIEATACELADEINADLVKRRQINQLYTTGAASYIAAASTTVGVGLLMHAAARVGAYQSDLLDGMQHYEHRMVLIGEYFAFEEEIIKRYGVKATAREPRGMK